MHFREAYREEAEKVMASKHGSQVLPYFSQAQSLPVPRNRFGA
jgi:hypothetical protein